MLLQKVERAKKIRKRTRELVREELARLNDGARCFNDGFAWVLMTVILFAKES